MVLEAVMICVDNSEPMRNGDYSPTRFQAMVEAVNEIANAKISGNNETTVGVMSMAGRIEVHLSPCGSLGSIMSCLQKEVKIGGECNFVGALKTAQLALKNRPNKSQKQRIILFVGSPITEDGKELVKLGKVFKKNNVAVDVVNFGTENSQGQKTQNPEKLEAFIGAVNSSDNSHLVHIPPGPHIFSDLVLTSALMVSGAAGAGATSTAAAPGLGPGLGLGGVDPNMEPELAMALRISQEEARQQQEKAAKEAKAAGKPVAMDESQDEEAQMLAAAIAMSMAAGQEQAPTSQPKPATAPANNNSNNQSANTSGGGTAKPPAPKSEATPMEDVDDVLKDPDFINSLLESVPGMNKDVTVDDILATMGDKDKDKDGKKKEDPKKDGGKK